VADIPNAEMTTILELRCSCPPTHANALVAIMDDLRQRRSKTGVFLGKDGLITPRDLLRWAERHATSKLDLARDGYMLLAERLRTPEEKLIVKEEIEKRLKVKIDIEDFYFGEQSPARKELQNCLAKFSGSLSSPKLVASIAATRSVLRVLNLVLRCIRQREPVLLVGGRCLICSFEIFRAFSFSFLNTYSLCQDTGAGKTTVIELLGLMLGRNLQVINCHATTETSDLIGGLRPVRGRKLLVQQMVERMIEVLRKWPDKDLLLKLTIPEYLKPGKANDFSLHNSDMRDVTEETPLGVADRAPEEVIRLLNCLKKSSEEQKSHAEAESPRKRPKLSDEPTNVSPSIDPLMDEIEDLYRRYSSLFEWADGPVASAMRSGDMLLLDELSLAEDAVLERLNSVLEPSRSLVLAEKGEGYDLDSESDSRVIEAHENFRVFATMNPGGDFGKRELSPALRSRFTEVWVPPVDDREDIQLVLARALSSADKEVHSCSILEKMLTYVEWFNNCICKNPASPYPGLTLSLRDISSWTSFVIRLRNVNPKTNVWDAYCHGAALMHLDGLGLGTGLSLADTSSLSAQAREYLLHQVESPYQVTSTVFSSPEFSRRFTNERGLFGIDPFWLERGRQATSGSSFNFSAPGTAENVYRVLRAMQLPKPILLEGSPGVGKTR